MEHKESQLLSYSPLINWENAIGEHCHSLGNWNADRTFSAIGNHNETDIKYRDTKESYHNWIVEPEV